METGNLAGWNPKRLEKMEGICVCWLFFLVYVEDTDVGFYGQWAGDGWHRTESL